MVNNQYPATNLEAFMKIAANWQNTGQNLLDAVDIKGEMQQYMNNTTMNMYKKRERTQNWNHQEKKFLLDLCRKDMRIIENKRLDAGLTAVKNKAWKIIHQKFSRQFGTDRTCNRLKEQWRRMKACTRNEILDYNNRLAKFGAEVADRKRPSPFTFEVWDFMQEAKKACKSEALDGIDYSKIPLALEEDFDYREDEHNADEEHDMDDSRTPPQELCDVDIKEETNETLNEHFNGSYQEQFADTSILNNNNNSSSNNNNNNNNNNNELNNYPQHVNVLAANAERVMATVSHSTSQMHNRSTNGDSLKRIRLHSPLQGIEQHEPNALNFLATSNSDLGAFQPAFNMSNISATLEALNAIRNGQFPNAAVAAAALQKKLAAAAHQQQQTISTTPPMKRARTTSSNCTLDREITVTPTAELDAVSVKQEPQQQTQTSSISNNNSNPNINEANELKEVTADLAEEKGNNNSAEIRALMDMQNKEHLMRMKILEVQLQAAKHNRDLIEINKTFALQRLQEFASRRLTN